MIRSNALIQPNDFNKWLHSPIQTINGPIMENGKYITHANFISQVYNDIQHILISNNYCLSNKKAFKHEFMKYIYSISDH